MPALILHTACPAGNLLRELDILFLARTVVTAQPLVNSRINKPSEEIPVGFLHLLLEDNHFAQERQLICLELVEIDATRNTFAYVVPAIPIGGTAPVGVVAFPLMSEIQLADDRTACVINGNLHVTGIC